jgi:hypothetical protein
MACHFTRLVILTSNRRILNGSATPDATTRNVEASLGAVFSASFVGDVTVDRELIGAIHRVCEAVKLLCALADDTEC